MIIFDTNIFLSNFLQFFDRVNMITADNAFPHAWRYSNDKKNLFESVDFYAISQLDKSTLFNEEGYSIKLDKNINNDFIKEDFYFVFKFQHCYLFK